MSIKTSSWTHADLIWVILGHRVGLCRLGSVYIALWNSALFMYIMYMHEITQYSCKKPQKDIALVLLLSLSKIFNELKLLFHKNPWKMGIILKHEHIAYKSLMNFGIWRFIYRTQFTHGRFHFSDYYSTRIPEKNGNTF